MIVDVIQFIRPDGRRKEETTDISDSCTEKYEMMLAAGCRLTAEVLSTGQVSLCIEEPELGDFDCGIVANGPEVITILERMINDFTLEKFNEWKKEILGEEEFNKQMKSVKKVMEKYKNALKEMGPE